MIHGATLLVVILWMPHGLLAGIYQIIFKLKGAIRYGDK
jgi:hypothetical protein